MTFRPGKIFMQRNTIVTQYVGGHVSYKLFIPPAKCDNTKRRIAKCLSEHCKLFLKFRRKVWEPFKAFTDQQSLNSFALNSQNDGTSKNERLANHVLGNTYRIRG